VNRWCAHEPDPKQPSPGTVLARQCDLWYRIATGQKRATELLEPDNYLDAARRMAGRLSKAAGQTIMRSRALVIAILALLVVAGLLLANAGSSNSHGAAGLTGLLAALGLTWKGIGGMIGKLADQLEIPLWNAEIDGAVTDAITMLEERRSLLRLHRVIPGDYADRAQRYRRELEEVATTAGRPGPPAPAGGPPPSAAARAS
jgi:hypothetical protein